ncbi:hypothetical protein MCELHM10_03371 [Paracoccaceae bacterium]|jgi:hypothetical protein
MQHLGAEDQPRAQRVLKADAENIAVKRGVDAIVSLYRHKVVSKVQKSVVDLRAGNAGGAEEQCLADDGTDPGGEGGR